LGTPDFLVLSILVVITEASNSPEAEYVLSEVLLAQRERRFIIPLKIHSSSGPLDIMLASRNWINAWDGSDPLPKILAAVAAQMGARSFTEAKDFAQLIVDAAFRQHVNRETFELALPTGAALLEPGKSVTICRLGRDPRGDLAFTSALPFVSRQHARIYALSNSDGSTFMLTDEQSRHGVFVNGTRIDAPYTLLDGDQIGLGISRSMLLFERLAVTGEPSDTWEDLSG
jgi:hypothetical protein